MKLTKEKHQLTIQLEKIQEKVDNGMAPSENLELNFLKMVRDEKNFNEENKKRIAQTNFRKFDEPFLLKTTAEKRTDHFINKLGLPQPYFKEGPFKP